MRSDILEKHIIDTIKEWQLKIGYQKGNMKLYYPKESLLLDLEAEGEGKLEKALETFQKEVRHRLGNIGISHKDDRYCLDIPEKGCSYVAHKTETPEFLKRLLEVITTPGNTMKEVEECFRTFAKERQTQAEMRKGIDHGTGHVFYFADPKADEYVYCVEENEFGLTYHRFSRTDYEGL